MEKRERLIARLRAEGFKLTPQRLAIIELLEEGEHPSAEEIYKKLSQRYPMVSRATVYNTLEVLKGLGELIELRLKSQAVRYDLKTTPHYHFLCRRCGAVFDLGASLEADRFIGREIEGHKVEEVQVSLYGLCARCAGNEER